MPTDPDRGSTTPRRPSQTTPPATQPVVSTTRRVTFSPLMLIEALNSAYPGLDISSASKITRQGDAGEYTVFEWDE